MNIRILISTITLIIIPNFIFSQVYMTTSSGDLESSSTWVNNSLPPFNILSDDTIEVPEEIELIVQHNVSTIRNEVVNRGSFKYELYTEEIPTINWRNFGQMTLGGGGWAIMDNYFINEPSGTMLFKDPTIYCHHLGCGSENYGTIYVNGCTSNPCAANEDSGFVNKESGEIIICDMGYIENNWFNVGFASNLKITNEGLIRSHTASYGVVSDGSPPWGAQGTYLGNDIIIDETIQCNDNLDEVSTSTNSSFFYKSISIYPNPNNGVLYLKSDVEIDEIQIINQFGKRISVLKSNLAIHKLDLNYANGIYILNFIHRGTVINSEKIILLK